MSVPGRFIPTTTCPRNDTRLQSRPGYASSPIFVRQAFMART